MMEKTRQYQWGKRDWAIVQLMGFGAAIGISGTALAIGMTQSPEKYPAIWAKFALPLISVTCLVITPTVLLLYVLPRMEELNEQEIRQLNWEIQRLLEESKASDDEEKKILRLELGKSNKLYSALLQKHRALTTEPQKPQTLKPTAQPEAPTPREVIESPWGEDPLAFLNEK